MITSRCFSTVMSTSNQMVAAKRDASLEQTKNKKSSLSLRNSRGPSSRAFLSLPLVGAVAFWVFNLKFENAAGGAALKSHRSQPGRPRAKARGFSFGERAMALPVSHSGARDRDQKILRRRGGASDRGDRGNHGRGAGSDRRT